LQRKRIFEKNRPFERRFFPALIFYLLKMGIKTQIDQDLVAAMKAKNDIAVGSLRLVKAAILTAEKMGKEVSEDELLAVVRSFAKKLKEAIVEYTKVGRLDLAANEQQQLEVVSKYLPKQLSLEEIKIKVSVIAAALPADKKNNVGMIVGRVMADLKGEADGALVRQSVEEILRQ
jgi:hypothetical protein